jgi:hypothetical protein
VETRHKVLAGGAAGLTAIALVIFVVVPFVIHIATLLGVAAIAFIAGEVHGRLSVKKQPELPAPPGQRPLPGSEV